MPTPKHSKKKLSDAKNNNNTNNNRTDGEKKAPRQKVVLKKRRKKGRTGSHWIIVHRKMCIFILFALVHFSLKPWKLYVLARVSHYYYSSVGVCCFCCHFVQVSSVFVVVSFVRTISSMCDVLGYSCLSSVCVYFFSRAKRTACGHAMSLLSFPIEQDLQTFTWCEFFTLFTFSFHIHTHFILSHLSTHIATIFGSWSTEYETDRE